LTLVAGLTLAASLQIPLAQYNLIVRSDSLQLCLHTRVICIMQCAAFIISFMKTPHSHPWDVDSSQARELQRRLSFEVIRCKGDMNIKLIAGIDVSVSRLSRAGRAAVVVLDYRSLELHEVCVAEGDIDFPYIPGLLSFREAPLALRAWQGLKSRPDLLMVDGQGIAHPRRLGIASHLGLLLDIPAIGCAKTRLTGTHDSLPEEAGSYRLLKEKNEIIGAAVRTKRAVKPVYVSIGHRIDLDTAISLVLECCRGFRLPQPTRLAHISAGGSSVLPGYGYIADKQKVQRR
jgi:deoxyribonuclease V